MEAISRESPGQWSDTLPPARALKEERNEGKERAETEKVRERNQTIWEDFLKCERSPGGQTRTCPSGDEGSEGSGGRAWAGADLAAAEMGARGATRGRVCDGRARGRGSRRLSSDCEGLRMLA